MNLVESAIKVANKLREYSIHLAGKDIEAALRVAEGYGHFLSMNYVGVLADREFEKELSGQLAWLLKVQGGRSGSGTLHLMTAAYVTGGHTRVVERLLGAGLGDGLASLDKVPEPVLGRTPKHVKIFNGIRKDSGIATISEILDVGLRYRQVILHIHPQDVYSAMASMLLAKMGVSVFMYNHADHVFSFGYGSAEKIFEISKYGWIKGAARGIEHKQSFVGIPVPHTRPRGEIRPQKKTMHMFMAGPPYKFHPWGKNSVPEFINQLHKEWMGWSGWKITVCGPAGREKIWRSLNKDARCHVEFLGPRPHAEYLDLLLDADCYVDSFPVGNGTGFVEAVMNGVPSFGLGLFAGYSCAEVLKSNSVQDLISGLDSFMDNKDAASYRLLEVRNQVIHEQSISACLERMTHAMEGRSNIPLLNSLASMNCMDGTFESYWESKKKININIAVQPKLSILQKIAVVRCLSDAIPYVSM